MKTIFVICFFVLIIIDTLAQKSQIDIYVNKSQIYINVGSYRYSKFELFLVNKSELDLYFFYNFKDLTLGSYFDQDDLCKSDSLISKLVLILKDSLGNLIVPRFSSHSSNRTNRFRKYLKKPFDYYIDNKFILSKGEKRKFQVKLDFFDSFNLYPGKYSFIILYFAGPNLKSIIDNIESHNVFFGCVYTEKIDLIIRNDLKFRK